MSTAMRKIRVRNASARRPTVTENLRVVMHREASTHIGRMGAPVIPAHRPLVQRTTK